MTISVDSNIFVGLWDEDEEINMPAKKVLRDLSGAHRLLISGVVFAELLGGPEREAGKLLEFFRKARITIDWTLSEEAFHIAGESYQGYWTRRRKRSADTPRRILTDFLIGAHAQAGGHALLTLDQRLYRAAFPKLQLMRI
jgi:predicted nucleic acid-binding protein